MKLEPLETVKAHVLRPMFKGPCFKAQVLRPKFKDPYGHWSALSEGTFFTLNVQYLITFHQEMYEYTTELKMTEWKTV